MRVESVSFLLLLFGCLLCTSTSNAKAWEKDKKKKPDKTKEPTTVPSFAPSFSPSKTPSRRPTKAPVKAPSSIDSTAGLEVTFNLQTFLIKFESASDSDSYSINEKDLESVTEGHFATYIGSQEKGIKDAFVRSIISVKMQSNRRTRSLRYLEGNEVVAEVGGAVTFKNGDGQSPSITQDLVTNMQTQAFNEEYASALTDMTKGKASATVVISETSIPNTSPDNVPVGNKNGNDSGNGNGNGGRIAGSFIGSLAAICLLGGLFVKHKKRKISNKTATKSEYHVPEVIVREGGEETGVESFEAVMSSPTFSIQQDAKHDKKGFKMPLATRVRSLSAKRTGVSVTGSVVSASAHDDLDTYSLDGSMALGKNPNLGDKMLGQVLAMSNYTPASNVTCLNHNQNHNPTPTSNGRPTHIVRVISKHSINGDDVSVFTYSNECDTSVLGSVMDGVNLTNTSMMSETLTTHGRPLSKDERESPQAQDGNMKDECETDEVEATIDRPLEAGSDSEESADCFDNLTPAPIIAENMPDEKIIEAKSPTRKLIFEPIRKAWSDFGVNILETEKAGPIMIPIEKKSEVQLKPPDYWNEGKIGGAQKQVQRIEKQHKLTITTKASRTSIVKSKYPIQAQSKSTSKKSEMNRVNWNTEGQSLLDEDSSYDGDSYSSYYSSGDDDDDVVKRKRNIQTNLSRRLPSIKIQHKNLERESIANKRRAVVTNGVFPIRPPEQSWNAPRSPTSICSKGSRGIATIYPHKQQEVNETIRSKGISTTNYAATARRNRMARKMSSSNGDRLSVEDDGKDSISNQVASLRRARLQQRTRI